MKKIDWTYVGWWIAVIIVGYVMIKLACWR